MKSVTYRHQSKGYGLRDYHKNICKQWVDIFKGYNKYDTHPEDYQSLLELWETDGFLLDGTCMTMREYARTLVQPYIQEKCKKDDEVSSIEVWDSFEDFLKDYMGDKYYNKI